MDRLKQWVALSVVVGLAILAGGWFLLVGPKRSEAAELRSQAEAEQLTNAQLETQLEVLRAKAADLPKKRAELAEVAAKVPDGPALPDLVRALTAAGRSAGVELVAVTPGAPAPLDGAAAPVAADPAADPAAAAPAAAPAAAGLSQVPVVIEVEGDFYELEQFLAALEDLPRALRVTALTVQAGAAAGGTQTLTSTVTGSAYMVAAPTPAPEAPAPGAPAPDSAVVADGAAPAPAAAAPAGGPAAPVTAR